MPDSPLILIADDEEDVRGLVSMNLRRAGFRTEEAADGLAALEQVHKKTPDAIVLDVMMPGCDGHRVCAELRSGSSTRHIPIIMLTARGQIHDRITGLEHGADDYLAKPFSPKELVLRVQALLRRSKPPVKVDEKLEIGPFEIDAPAMRLLAHGRLVDLTLLEFKVFHLLASAQGAVTDRDEILREVWGYNSPMRTRTLDTHVKRIREKLGPEADWIYTARGQGYALRKPHIPCDDDESDWKAPA